MHRTGSLTPENILDGLQTAIISRRILSFDEVTSTNNVAKRLAAEGAEEGTLVVAETQTHGRGRFGRVWFSPRGGLWFSVILRPRVKPTDALKITLMASVAVARSIRELLGLDARIKWPNDVSVRDLKLCGILSEMGLKDEAVEFVVVGVGLNANVELKELPEDVRSSSTSLMEMLGAEVSRVRVLQGILSQLELQYVRFMSQGFEASLKDWRELTDTLGSRVEVEEPSKKISGLAVGLDEDGALIVKLDDGDTYRVTGSCSVTVRK